VARELAGRSPLKPPPGRAPDASIIIPMFGQTSLVLGCLDSIARQKSRRSVEVIVWDDGSPASDAAEVIGHIPWVRYHRAEKNGGFLLAVNAAAKTAGGRWLLLLNSDVRVAAGWLDAILDTAESRPEAGIIGSKLFRADGRLQEAGGTVWRDGTTEHVGRGQDPESPEYATERKVDYCSAAAVCIPTTVWRDLGGFDPLFAPAYYEDTDLAFRVRETGREVWFCPEARALHYENRSYERDGPRGLSRFQVANQRRFAGRWANVLRQLPPPPGAEVDEEALGAAVAAEVRRFTSRSPLFEEFAPAAPGPPRAKAIAFYLPQFHAVPENDEWWGRGFTEWTNLPRGLPRFPGHYQPRVPRDLGFYDLTDPTVLPRQVDLARAGGVHGFCYYYYNFGGRRLLERPLEAMLARRDVDFPFCLMWTNENWSRRWDGSDDKILMKQEYGYEQAASLVDDLARHFRDPRYIRIGGRPLLIVYRAQLVKGGAQAFQRWRELFEAQHGEQPLILMAETFSDRDPRRYGLDGAVEFPPHKIFEGVRSTEKTLAMFDANASLKVHTYGSALLQARRTEPPPYALLRTVFPSWDNDARRQGHGLAVTGSTPTKFAEWLEVSIAFAQANPFHGEPIVMINAWNEWAEGAYLEPDIHFGAAYLNALSQVIFSRA
jgi:GT2 family glycosyltransferase